MNILCVGGGPAGLFFAIAVKRHEPRHHVTVVERRPPGPRYGWGIALSTSTDRGNDLLHTIGSVDAHAAAAIQAVSVGWTGQRVSVRHHRPVHLGGSGYCIDRQVLNDILLRRARAVGAEVHLGTQLIHLADTVGADLVVLADGAGSRLRRSLAHRFGTDETHSSNRHAWLGTRAILRDFTYAFEQTTAGWIWFYGYRHHADVSTVIVECSADTWRALGFDSCTPELATARLSDIFAQHLGGQPLESRQEPGRGIWEAFPTVRNEQWHAGNFVLLGDAAHTAHFSVGHGTTLALQDGAALGAALATCHSGGLPEILERYQCLRQPTVLAVQAAAERSAAWFESFESYAALGPVALGYCLRMRRNVAHPGAMPPRTPLLYGLHLATQWQVGRGARRAVATGRRAARRRTRSIPRDRC